MLLKIQKRYLCWLLALIMLQSIVLSGMCFEYKQTDSYFSYYSSSNQNQTNPVIKDILSSLIETSAEICTNEMLGQKEFCTAMRQIRLLRSRFLMRLQEIDVPNMLQNLSHSLIWNINIIRNIEYQDSGKGRIIISYIQWQDGKKGPLL